ncbi:MAG: sirohydrochlorin cobaltochelatase [Halieaceae bacterium]|jgi:sirohydrochlorin cobaltochelatase
MNGSHCILLAHGSRDPRWCETFQVGLASVESQLQQTATLAYMEMAKPSLEDTVKQQYQLGIRSFNVIPLFFAAGTHLLVDVPNIFEALRRQLPGVTFTLQAPLGEAPTFWEFVARTINDTDIVT